MGHLLHRLYGVDAPAVQNSCHHAQGSVDFRSAVHRRTPTTPSGDAVSAVHRCSASLCAVDTHRDSPKLACFPTLPLLDAS